MKIHAHLNANAPKNILNIWTFCGQNCLASIINPNYQKPKTHFPEFWANLTKSSLQNSHTVAEAVEIVTFKYYVYKNTFAARVYKGVSCKGFSSQKKKSFLLFLFTHHFWSASFEQSSPRLFNLFDKNLQ